MCQNCLRLPARPAPAACPPGTAVAAREAHRPRLLWPAPLPAPGLNPSWGCSEPARRHPPAPTPAAPQLRRAAAGGTEGFPVRVGGWASRRGGAGEEGEGWLERRLRWEMGEEEGEPQDRLGPGAGSSSFSPSALQRG